MINGNWTKYFAERLESLFSFIGAPVYSNIDPNREYTGGATVEIQESTAPTFTYFISGRVEIVHEFTVACRAPSEAQALDMARSARGLLSDVLKLWEEDGVIYGPVLTEVGATPDERGLVVGESFFSYCKFKFIENEGFPS